MKINLKELQKIKNLTYALDDVTITISMDNNEEINIDIDNLSESRKEWFNAVLNKAEKIAKDKYQNGYHASNKNIKKHNDKPLDNETYNIIDKLRNNPNIREEIKSLSKYGEKTQEEQIEMFLEKVNETKKTYSIPSVLSASTITYDNEKEV